ncbi:unnamed protein product [Phytomonas sp. EM1]|nr:unnamed protein product [Phytomonas sp. EM1]|eukprot:CCW64873.1 unnamed protein product [Phytomonas sp. isolate EM1]
MNSVSTTRKDKSGPTAESSKPKNLFSSSSSDEDELDHELASAAARERAKNPHAEQGRARKPQTNLTEARTKGSKEKSELDTNSDDSDEDVDEKQRECTAHHPSKDNLGKTATVNDRGDGNAIRINKEYARNYEQVKRKQELQRLTEKYGDRLASLKGNSQDAQDSDPDAESSDLDEDDNGLLLTAENELAFAKSLLAIRKANLRSGASKDKNAPKAGNQNDSAADSKRNEVDAETQREMTGRDILRESFFPIPEEQIKRNNEILLAKLEERKKQRKAKFTLANEYRRAIHLTAEDASQDKDVEDNGSGLRKLKPRTAEERAIRDSFLKSVSESTEAFSVNKVPSRSENNGRRDEKDKEELLMQERNNLLAEAFDLVDDNNDITESSEEEEEMANGHDREDDDDAHKTESVKLQGEGKKSQLRKKIREERFLKEFFIKELWRLENNNDGDSEDAEKGEGNKGHSAVLAELAQAEEDENFYNEAELWEREYQTEKYRHEEDGAYIEAFPRPIGEAAQGLLRKPNTSRKDARQRRKERIEAAKAQRTEELKRLKHLKRLEIDERRALIAAVAGLTSKKHPTPQIEGEGDRNLSFAEGSDEEEGKTLQKLTSIWTDEALNAPFDPAEFDKKMQQLFSDEYYEEPNMEEEMAYLDAELDNEVPLDLNDDTDAPHNDETPEGPLKGGTAPAKHQEVLQDLFREPDLFNVESLEEAKRIVQQKGDLEVSDLRPDEQDPLLRELGAVDTGPVDKESEDLLYPSSPSRRQVEGSGQEGRNKKGATPKEVKNENAEDENEALLSRLKQELSQKEEEYNKLHYDSTIAGGDVETRFHYREVPAEDFTLSIEEILCRDDRQLNMLAPMNCYAAYLDKKSNERDRRKIERRRQKGFREIDPNRTSRHYGDVSRTIVLDPNLSEEEGMKVAEQLRKRLRDDDGGLPDDEGPRGRGGRGERTPPVGRAGGRGRGAGAPNPNHGASNYHGGNRKPNSYDRGRGGRGRGGFAPRGHSQFRGSSSRGGHR